MILDVTTEASLMHTKSFAVLWYSLYMAIYLNFMTFLYNESIHVAVAMNNEILKLKPIFFI